MAKPVFKAKVGQYELAGWENTVKVNNQEVKKLGFTLTKSFKVGDEWKNQTINLSGINELRAFPQIATYLALKGEKMLENFDNDESDQDTNTPQQEVQNPPVETKKI